MLQLELDGVWKHIPVRSLIRAYIPAEFGECSFVFQIVGEPEDMVMAGIKYGVFIRANDLNHLCLQLGVGLPSRKETRKRVLKIDVAKHLVNRLFPG